MELDVHLVRFDGWNGTDSIGPGLVRVAQAVEAADVKGLTFMDHYFQIQGVGSPEEPMLEGYTALGFMAAHTTKASLGLLVTGVTYRHPGLLAKIVTTLDVLSSGRAVLGIGAAWFEREHLGLGVPYPPVAERFERLEETLQICQQMWSDDNGPYDGKHYQLAETLCAPRPISSPRPKILIGGGGERKTLRLVAQYADACNLFAQSPDLVSAKLDILRRHCDDLGRDYDTISKTVLYVSGDLADSASFLRDMQAYAALGVETVHVMPTGRLEQWIEERVAPVVPALREL